MKKLLIILLFALFISNLSAWQLWHDIYLAADYTRSQNDATRLKLEYYPSLQKLLARSGNIEIDGNIKLMTSGIAEYSDKDYSLDFLLRLYRFWLRSSTEQSEIRFGLQKINFGPASYLRSLAWFDRINNLDPRRQTEGVWSMLARYYTLESVNYWFWVIYNDAGKKGQELIASSKESLEMGGRIQLSVLAGDLGLSYHTRGLESSSLRDEDHKVYSSSYEKRIGVDARWDIGIGLWLESSISLYEEVEYLPLYWQLYTIGSDYTLNLGSGLHILAEHQYHRAEDSFWQNPVETSNITVLGADYPLNLYDKILFLAGYDHRDGNTFYYASYNMAYNFLSIYLNLSYTKADLAGQEYLGATSQKSVELLLQINY
jgi:hypothetical protein